MAAPLSHAEAVARPCLPRVGAVAALRVDGRVQIGTRDRQQLVVGRDLSAVGAGRQRLVRARVAAVAVLREARQGRPRSSD